LGSWYAFKAFDGNTVVLSCDRFQCRE